MRIVILVLATVLAAEPIVVAQNRSRPAQPAAKPYTAATTAILVDVVVRDKRDRPLTDLTAEDFELYEDGARQEIGSFSVISRGSGIGISVRKKLPGTTTVTTGSSAPDEPSEPPQRGDEAPPTTALVFDALGAERLHLAQKAALSYLPMSRMPGARVGVFSVDPGLRVLQRYTDDPAAVRQAVRTLTASGTARQELESERRTALYQRLRELDVFSGGPDGGGDAATPAVADSTLIQSIIERQITQSELRMQRAFESLDRDHRGFGTTDALITVVRTLSVLPGRKTIVYFSEGLPASPSMQARLDAVISGANRVNVSIYAVDAAGLRSESALLETRREVDAAGEERLRQNSVSREPSDGPMMRIVERTEDLLRLNPEGGLNRLASETGGFLVRDTNDLGSAFRRIDEDNRFHYMLTYAPSNENFDGKFRTISVKVKRDGAQVFSRRGYIAVRSAPIPGLGYEAPALEALEQGRPPNAFPISAAGLVFPAASGTAIVPVIVSVKTSELTLNVDDVRGTYTGQAAVVARIKDSKGTPLQTLSQQYLLTGSSKEADAAKQGEILFYRQPELAPGMYTLEAIVFDALSERGSARISTITVPAPDERGLPVSSLVLVRRTESVPADERSTTLPFYYGSLLLYPNVGEPLRKGTDTELLFYFTFSPRRGEGDVSAELELSSNGQAVARVPLELPRATPEGRVQHLGRLPIESFPAGTYELRLRLQEGQAEQVRSAFFTIVG